ncbi:MAG: putative YigZ family protein [Candidatus Krumholzibacteriia bacterium]|jgi:uncharacterized YigZ family protein
MTNSSSPIPPDRYHTIGGIAEAEIKIQRSRFIGLAGHASDEKSAREFIAAAAKKYHDSRHVCFGWRLGTPPQERENRSDDGEPSGTAGEPILTEIRKRQLSELVVVVVRYFGGIKLGTGGLARAYGQGAQLALQEAVVREVLQGIDFALCFPYALQKTIRHLIAQNDGKIVTEEYGADVHWQIWLPHSQCAPFQARLTEATSGDIQLEPKNPT